MQNALKPVGQNKMCCCVFAIANEAGISNNGPLLCVAASQGAGGVEGQEERIA